ncbi:MAG: tetratricopeptide repeat protein [Verrucomicrobiota bacterium]|nr:tetratricopeptide repeat protein [Verrucomicrobiota bacterium]
MKPRLTIAALSFAAAGFLFSSIVFAQVTPPPRVRRAQPVEQIPVARAIPVTPTPEPTVMRALPVPEVTTVIPSPTAAPSSVDEPPDTGAVSPDTRADSRENSADSPQKNQLDYANGLFSRKLYDLAVPEYEKFLGLYPNSSERATALFYMGQAYRALNRTTAARTSFQTVLRDFPESEMAGPASYGLAEIYFNDKDYAGAFPYFHGAAAKVKDSALALSARYFEARCLENLDRKDEARDVYQRVIAVDNPNPFRDDSRLAVGSIFLAAGRKGDALKQFEALANEASKPALKAEATVRAGLVALDLAQNVPSDKAMSNKATTLLKKGRSLPEAGRWSGVAAVGLLRLEFQAGDYAQAVADYQKSKDDVPEEVRPEMMLLAANSQRQLGHMKEAQAIYQQIIQKYPSREEAKDARYQRLIALYNANDPNLGTEIDQFLKDNPEGERADQAKLLKAEALYKEKDFAAAAPLYAGLRDSKLSAKLRAESAFKLGWCYVQTKQPEKVIEAFAYFLQAFPQHPQVPSALAQRALAYQEGKQYERARSDLEQLLISYPKAREREAALQQKALLLGQADDTKGMTATFQQLLKEYPKTAAAAQAHYYIGKSAFEAKDYETAIAEMQQARELNKEQYGIPAALRIMSSYFYLKQRDPLAKEVDSFYASSPNGQVPAEILEWLGLEFYNAKKYAPAAKYLVALSKTGNVSSVKPDFWFYLGDAQMKLNQPANAETSLQKFLETTTDPAAEAKALLALGEAKIGAHKPDDAQKIAEEIMKLQPEGRVNAQARLLAGEVEMEREKFEEAGKAFMSIALLYDDPEITPQALAKAAKAYQKAGKFDEAERANAQLRQKYPDYAGG